MRIAALFAAVTLFASASAVAMPSEYVGTWVGTMKGTENTYGIQRPEKINDEFILTLNANDTFTILGGRFNNSGNAAVGPYHGAVNFTGILVGSMTLHFDGKGGAKGLVTYSSIDPAFLSVEGKIKLKHQP